MQMRLLARTLVIALAASACDRDPPAEEALEEAQGTLEQAEQTTPEVVPVPVPVNTSPTGDTLIQADTIAPR